MIIVCFQSQFLVLQLVKLWSTVVNCMLIVVSDYLTTAKQCLTIFSFQKLCLFWDSPLDEAKTTKELLKKQKH